MRDEDFERLYAAEATGLFSFLAYRTGDRMVAQDLTADAFERALRARARFDRRRGSEKTWLYAIAVNLLRDRARSAAAEARAMERLGPARESALDAGLAAVDDRDELRQAIAALSPEERESVALRFGAQLTAPEIAAVLKENLTTIEGRIYRALRKMRTALEAPDATRQS
jgi:RNA polymerase sigma factor (sigma-70 family)